MEASSGGDETQEKPWCRRLPTPASNRHKESLGEQGITHSTETGGKNTGHSCCLEPHGVK